MADCHFERDVRARLADEEPLSEGQVGHLRGCASCSTLVDRAESLDAALARSTGTLVTADLPAGTLQMARAGRRRSGSRRFAFAAVAAMTMILAMAGAAVTAGLLPPSFDDGALRTDPAAYAALEDCLGKADFTPRPMPAGDVPVTGDGLAYERAFLLCIVESGVGEVDGDDPAEVAYANAVAMGITECLRHQGWDLPDPELEPLGRYLEPPSGTVSDDAEMQSKFNADLEECGLRFGIEFEE